MTVPSASLHRRPLLLARSVHAPVYGATVHPKLAQVPDVGDPDTVDIFVLTISKSLVVVISPLALLAKLLSRMVTAPVARIAG